MRLVASPSASSSSSAFDKGLDLCPGEISLRLSAMLKARSLSDEPALIDFKDVAN